jgi:hypothetical protein
MSEASGKVLSLRFFGLVLALIPDPGRAGDGPCSLLLPAAPAPRCAVALVREQLRRLDDAELFLSTHRILA